MYCNAIYQLCKFIPNCTAIDQSLIRFHLMKLQTLLPNCTASHGVIHILMLEEKIFHGIKFWFIYKIFFNGSKVS